MRINPDQIVGQKFGNLTVVRSDGQDKWNHQMFSCDCDCGRTGVRVLYNALRSGNTRSCGCIKSQQMAHYKPGFSKKTLIMCGVLNKTCEGCQQGFKIEYGPPPYRSFKQAEKIRFCDPCLLKKKLGTKITKYDW